MRKSSIFMFFFVLFMAMIGPDQSVRALDALPVDPEFPVQDLQPILKILPPDPSIQVLAAPDAEGTVLRMELERVIAESNDIPHSGWLVFALQNQTAEPTERLLVVPHHALPGSGIWFPRLDALKLGELTSSTGVTPANIFNPSADVYSLTLGPGVTATYVAAVYDSDLPSVELWKPSHYQLANQQSARLQGALLGVAVLIAIILTIAFVVTHASIFASSAVLAWIVVLICCIQFRFLPPALIDATDAVASLRSVSELWLGLALVNFLLNYLSAHHWIRGFSWASPLIAAAGAAGLLLGFSFPASVSATARILLLVIAVTGLLALIYLAIKRFGRARQLAPGWILLCGWMWVSTQSVSGYGPEWANDATITGGLVIVILVLALTVLQLGFRGSALVPAMLGEAERNILAMLGSEFLIWDWDVARNRVVSGRSSRRDQSKSPHLEDEPMSRWLDHVHYADRKSFSAAVKNLAIASKGVLRHDFRLVVEGGRYRWVSLRARPVVGPEGGLVRCIGTVEDIHQQRLDFDRCLRTGSHDILTNLPGSDIFRERVDTLVRQSRFWPNSTIAVIFIQPGSPQHSAGSHISVASDTTTVMVARRLCQVLADLPSPARVSAHRFALALISPSDVADIGPLMERIRSEISRPIHWNDQTFSCQVSLGLAIGTGTNTSTDSLIEQAEDALVTALSTRSSPIVAAPIGRADTIQSNLKQDFTDALKASQIHWQFTSVLNANEPEDRRTHLAGSLHWTPQGIGEIEHHDLADLARRNQVEDELWFYAFEVLLSEDIAHIQSDLVLSEKPLILDIRYTSNALPTSRHLDIVRSLMKTHRQKDLILRIECDAGAAICDPIRASSVFERLNLMGIQVILGNFGLFPVGIHDISQMHISEVKFSDQIVESWLKDNTSDSVQIYCELLQRLGLTISITEPEDASLLPGLAYLPLSHIYHRIRRSRPTRWFQRSGQSLVPANEYMKKSTESSNIAGAGKVVSN